MEHYTNQQRFLMNFFVVLFLCGLQLAASFVPVIPSTQVRLPLSCSTDHWNKDRDVPRSFSLRVHVGRGNEMDADILGTPISRNVKDAVVPSTSDRLSSNIDTSQWKRRHILQTLTGATAVGVLSTATSPVDATTEVQGAENTDDKTAAAPYRVSFQLQLEEKDPTTNEIVVEVHPEWAPLAAQRFQELVDAHFFDQGRFFRVLPGYVAQFGIAGDPALNKQWLLDSSKALPDEVRKVSNRKGTLSFASTGKANSRQTQIFINLADNGGPPNFLDAQGFVPFARVVEGMDTVVPKIYSGYGLMETATAGMAGSVNPAKAAYYGNEYLEALFPKLSYIQSTKVITRIE